MTSHPSFNLPSTGHADGSGATAQIGVMKATVAFGQIVAMMMQSEKHRSRTLADLEWMLLPALRNRQFVISETVDEVTGLRTPTAVILWALVSDDVDRRLTADPTTRLTLKPDEWKSGMIPWFIDAAGDQQAVLALAKFLAGERFKDSGLKLVGAGGDGKPVIGVLRALSQSPPPNRQLS